MKPLSEQTIDLLMREYSVQRDEVTSKFNDFYVYLSTQRLGLADKDIDRLTLVQLKHYFEFKYKRGKLK